MGTEMSQHEKLTLEKNIPAPILPGLEPETFRSGVRRSITELSALIELYLSYTQHLYPNKKKIVHVCHAYILISISVAIQTIYCQIVIFVHVCHAYIVTGISVAMRTS